MNVINNCIKSGTFPDQWKTAKLLFIEKPKKSTNDAPIYRPISLINVLGKILEKVIKNRLEDELNARNIIHHHQFGFRKRKITLNALQKVKDVMDKINQTSYGHRSFAAMVTIDMKNAFNSAPWNKIVDAVQKAKTSPYLLKITQ